MKNFLFFGNAEAETKSALLYTLVANCKAQDIDPERYFAEVLRRLPAAPTEEQANALTPEQLAEEIHAEQHRSVGLKVDLDAA